MEYKYSQFFFGHTVNSQNCYIDFIENSVVKYAIMKSKSYTLNDYSREIARALNESGDELYTTTVNRELRIITIETDNNFSLLISSGENKSRSFSNLAGFENIDLVGLSSYSGVVPSGSVYSPQAPISKYTPFDEWEGVSGASVSRTISGRKKIVSYGEESFMECNIYPITEFEISSFNIMKNNQSAKSEVLGFLKYIRSGNPVEFMFDIDTPGAFDGCYIESTSESKDGTMSKLKKYKNIIGWYETGILKFRKII